MAAAVGMSRVYLGYHYLDQVALGALVGAVDGFLFFLLAHFYLLPVVAKKIEHSDVGRCVGDVCSLSALAR